MKLMQSTPTVNNIKNNKNNNGAQTSFKSGEAGVLLLNYLQTNQAWGATAVDVCCMGLPRTTVDFTRSPEAGVETMRREFSSTLNDLALGMYGMGAATILATGFNKQFGVKANKMFLGDDAVEIMAQTWKEATPATAKAFGFAGKIVNSIKGAITKAPQQSNVSKDAPIEHIQSFVKNMLSQARAFEGKNATDSLDKAWIGIKPETQSFVADRFMDEIKTNSSIKMKDATKDLIRNAIIESTGVEERIKISNKNINKSAESTLDDFIEGVYKMSKTFSKGKVVDAFNATKNISENAFVKGFKNLNKKTAIVGLAASLVVGLSIQPLNTYLTKRKTGKSEFVGGGEENKTASFKLLKLAVAALAGTAALRTIGKGKNEILKNIQFKSLVPTLNQFKLVFGATIASRMLFSRNENELRETSFKDTLAFANWLILGGFVSKFTAAAFEKGTKQQYIRHNEAENGKGFFKWLTNSSIMTRREVLISALKEKGISTIKDNKALSMKELLKEAAIHAPEARKKVRNLGFIQFAGYLYSGVVLGFGLPKANIAITKFFSNRKKEAENKAAA